MVSTVGVAVSDELRIDLLAAKALGEGGVALASALRATAVLLGFGSKILINPQRIQWCSWVVSDFQSVSN